MGGGQNATMQQQNLRVAVVIATLPARGLHLEQALRAVAEQERLPEEIFIVVDHPPGEQVRAELPTACFYES